MKTHDDFFLQTLALAKKGRGYVAPNPEVGAIVVKNRKVIGQGFHEYFGEAHAEVNAIQDAEKKGYSVEGSQIFVSLEPCCHRNKKTPLCTMLLIEKKIAEVYVFFLDPNPKVAGKGVKILQSAGIKVVFASHELQKNTQDFYEKFSFWIQHKVPFCTLKLAQSRNGYIGEQNKQISISGKECRKYTLTQRDKHQSILIGSQTLLVDNPTLSGQNTRPIRLVLDGGGKIFRTTNIKKMNFFRDNNYFYITSESNFLEASKVFGKTQVLACPFVSLEENIFDLFALKKILASQNISSVFIEGGGVTAHNFLKQEAVQKCIIYTSSKNIDEKIGIKGVDIQKFSFLKKQEKYSLGVDIATIYTEK